ncbi:phosphomevalonate kinase isoform X2 [Oryzias melastigma]|uniref:phosphomevalonate kinase isoform X2 n=1 Tax=Oryzias melastigma TaxID=30732 RepID=UPI00168D1A4D|nr:phosphomevalonate kinase isoform X2 [Oryzias melastigma]
MEVRGPGPELVLVFSGKRKSGKDYITDLISDRLGPAVCSVLRLSGPLKKQYAQDGAGAHRHPVIGQVVSDARRLSDLQWFRSEFTQQTVSVRVQCSNETRQKRGWSFTPGVDDAESECGLDEGVHFDWVITNEAAAPPLDEQLQPILDLARKAAASANQ